MADISLPPPGGSGLVDHLYEYLWAKNNLLQTRCMYHKCPPVLVPDTILLNNKQPIAWYFTSLKSGTLQRRTKEIDADKISEALIRRTGPDSDVLERLCACIAEHVNLVSNQLYTVTHMVLNFKIDSEDRVWLLWCEHLEVSDEKGHPLPMQVEYPRDSGNISDREADSKKDDTFSRKHSKSRTRSRDKQRKSSKRWDSDEENDSPRRRKHEFSDTLSDEDADLILSSAPSSVRDDYDEGFSPDFVLLPETKRSSGKAKGIRGHVQRTSKKPQERERPASESSSSVNDENTLAQENQSANSGSRARSAGSRAQEKSRTPKGQERNTREQEFKLTMREEKKRREEAERKAMEAEQKLRLAEAKARAAEMKLRKVSQEPVKGEESLSAGAAKPVVLPSIQKQPASAKPTPQTSPMEALIPLEEGGNISEAEEQSRMAEAVFRAADIESVEASEVAPAAAQVPLPSDPHQEAQEMVPQLQEEPDLAQPEPEHVEQSSPPDEPRAEQPAAEEAAPQPEAQGHPEPRQDSEQSDASIGDEESHALEPERDGTDRQQPQTPSVTSSLQEAAPISSQEILMPSSEESADTQVEEPEVRGAAPSAEIGEDADSAQEEDFEDKPIQGIETVDIPIVRNVPPAQPVPEAAAAHEAPDNVATAPVVDSPPASQDALLPAVEVRREADEVRANAGSSGGVAVTTAAPAEQQRSPLSSIDATRSVKCSAMEESSEEKDPGTKTERILGEGDDSKPMDKHLDGDQVERDSRLINQTSSFQFRSEVRVGSQGGKWQSLSLPTQMEGQRVGTNASCYNTGSESFSVASIFDQDEFQPPHLQALVQGEVHFGIPNDSDRCSEHTELRNVAFRNTSSEYHDVDDMKESYEIAGSSDKGSQLPEVRRKGFVEKQRETRVEMICTPISNMDTMEQDFEEFKVAYGLPSFLWQYEQPRGEKDIYDADEESARVAEDKEFVSLSEREKGAQVSQIETTSSEFASTSDRGYAPEFMKSFGSNAGQYEGQGREISSENIVKNSEWAFDEYLRIPADEIKYNREEAEAEAGEVIELKYDLAFSNDEERQLFAKSQREKLAKALGIPIECIEISDVKPGSPMTLLRLKVRASDAALIPASSAGASEEPAAPQDAEGALDVRPVAVSMLETAQGSGHRLLSTRLHETFGGYLEVEDKAVQERVEKTAPADVLDSLKAYAKEVKDFPRYEDEGRCKGNCDSSVPGVRHEAPEQLEIFDGEVQSICSQVQKVKGQIAQTDDMGVDPVYKPGREIMLDDQYSSAKVQRRPPGPAKRFLDVTVISDKNFEEQVKIPYQEVENTRRLKEQEDELNFLPAQRAAMGPRTAILARKDEGLEDLRYDRMDEHDTRIEEKLKEQASLMPSLKLTKAVEEVEYELSQKVTGREDPRTTIPCEPAGLSAGDRREKRKGKNGEKLGKAAIPEQYMAFGTEGESQRLAPNIVTLDKHGVANVEDMKQKQFETVKDKPGLMEAVAPDLIQMKFDVSFVDEKARMDFAEKQRINLAKLLRIPEDSISVRLAVPGSPITVITFQVESGVVRPIKVDEDLTRESRPFDQAVLDVAILSPQEESADALISNFRGIFGPSVPVSRMTSGAGQFSYTSAEKSVKFSVGKGEEKVPAYLRSREELEGRAKHEGGALISEKEAIEAAHDEELEKRGGSAGAKGMAEYKMDDKKPILSYDRRLPKSAKNKQHLLSRIHTIESTLQRLYGKLEADTELPDIDSIEQIMSATIKQTVYTSDRPDEEYRPPATKKEQELEAHAVQPQRTEKMAEEASGVQGWKDSQDAPGPDEQERKLQLRLERRKRMEDRERFRRERESLELMEKPSVSFELAEDADEEMDIGVLKAMQAGGEIRLRPKNIPAGSYDEGEDEADDLAGGASYRDAPDSAQETAPQNLSRRKSTDMLDLTKDEIRAMAAEDETTAWKSAYSKVRHGKKSELIALLDSGCPVDLKDQAGNTLLNISAQNGHKSIIKALLRRGAALNTQNHNGQTPLHFCFTYGYTDLGNYLISKGADDTVQNFAGLTCYEGLGEG
eukprot:765309-Hanusia_phi.AAC.5